MESYKLEMATTPGFSDFQILYQGPDMGHFISGLKNGDYYFRLCGEIKTASESERLCSATKEIKVKHHNLHTAFGFFFTGAIAFGAILFVIIKGADKKEEIA